MTPKRTFGWKAGLLALLVALVVVEPVVAQDVFFTQSGGRGLQNAKSNARISKVETDVGVIQDDLKTIQPFARREIPSCDSTGAKLLWRRDNWSCDDETDPTVQPFAKKALPSCGAGQILAASGSDFSCANSGFLSAESDPTVQGFAKAALPSCSSGSVLSAVNGALKCVSDNAGLTAETDPLVHDFARTTTATIENCDSGEVLKMTNDRLECVADQGITAETDPRVQAFARNDTTGATLTACTSGQVVVSELSGSNVVLKCKDGGTALASVLSAQTLAGLADVVMSGPASDDVLRFNGTKWENSSDKIGTTTDTKWCYFSSNNIVCDRNVPAPMPAAACTASEIISWDGTSWSCVAISSAVGGALALDDLNDVSITTPISGQGLTYTGSGWENGYDTRVAQGNSDVRVVDGGTGAVQTVVDNGAVMTAFANMVGINTTSPNASLDVVGLVSATAFNTSGYVNAALVQGAVVSASQIHTSGTVVGGELRSVSDTYVGQDLYVSRNLYVSGSQSIDGVMFANGGVSASGVISATRFAGDGSGLTGVVASSVDKVISGTTRIDLMENGNIRFTTAGVERAVLTSTGRLDVNGDVSATNISAMMFDATRNGTVSATYGYFGNVSSSSYSGNGSGLTGVTANAMSWFGLTNVPNPVTYISDSALTAAEVTQLENIGTSVLPASVWGNLAYLNQSVSTTSAPTFAGLTLNGDVTALGRYMNLQSGGLISATTGNFGTISATDVHIMGNLYVSGSQNIDGVLFANGGVQATGAVTGPLVSVTTVNAQYASFTTLHAGNLSGDLSWYSLTNVPAQVQEVSDSGAISMVGISATNISVTAALTANTLTAPNGTINSLSSNAIGANIVSSSNISATYVDATRNGTVSATYGYFGNVSSSSYSGNGSGLTGVTASSVAWNNVTAKPASIVSLSTGLTVGLAVNDVVYFDGTDYQTTSATTLLGLGTMAYQNSNAVAIMGGSINTASLLSGTQIYGYYASFTTASIGGLGVGNINASGLIATARVSATNDINTYYLSATTAFLGNVTSGLVSSTAVNGYYASFTTAGVGGLTASGIVTASTFEGDGSRLTGITLGSGAITAAGNSGELQIKANDATLGASSTLVWQSGLYAEPNLKVVGTIQVAGTDDAEACVAGKFGTIRMNPTTGAMEVCRQ
ncbi:MAG: hypothetical protein WAZ18_06130 [Alphaproteobacteria bacterium]